MVNRLNSSGFEAYIVGGGVRDLMLRKAPKDFDIATNATPQQIRQLFKNGRIIGRRFKLVHVLFHREIIEVATFRSQGEVDENQVTNDKGMLVRDNVYGTIDQDAFRRDFTINSLFYNVADASIIDFTGGVEDIHNKQIRIIGDPEVRYKEDPVRMLRAIRFSAKLHFSISPETERAIPKLAHLITHVSNSRLFDEMTKLYQCGEAVAVQNMLVHYGIFQMLCAQSASCLETAPAMKALLGIALENTDTRIRDNKPVTPAFIFAVLLWFPMQKRAESLQKSGLDPLPALEKAMSETLSEQCKTISIPKRFSLVMREIWLLQYRFSKRQGNRAFHLLEHPRFRAAYDFMAIRALAGDEGMELAQWWTTFQEVTPEERQVMINELTPAPAKKRRRRRKPAAPAQ